MVRSILRWVVIVKGTSAPGLRIQANESRVMGSHRYGFLNSETSKVESRDNYLLISPLQY